MNNEYAQYGNHELGKIHAEIAKMMAKSTKLKVNQPVADCRSFRLYWDGSNYNYNTMLTNLMTCPTGFLADAGELCD